MESPAVGPPCCRYQVSPQAGQVLLARMRVRVSMNKADVRWEWQIPCGASSGSTPRSRGLAGSVLNLAQACHQTHPRSSSQPAQLPTEHKAMAGHKDTARSCPQRCLGAGAETQVQGDSDAGTWGWRDTGTRQCRDTGAPRNTGLGHGCRDTRVQGLVLQYHRCIHALLLISQSVPG